VNESDPRFLHLEWKVGLFVFVAVVLAVAVTAYVAIEHDLWVPKHHLRFIADSGKELHQGMAVKFSGFRIGKVDKLTLSAWAEVAVTIEIDQRYMDWIRSDSKALLVQEGLLGESVIEIIPGSPMAQELGENATLPFERRAGLNDMLAELDQLKLLVTEIRQGGIGEMLANARRASGEFLATRQHVDDFLATAEQTLAHMDRVLRQAGETITHTDQTVGRTDALIGRMEGTAGHLDRVATNAEEALPPLLARSAALLARMETATARLAEAADRAPALADQGSALAEEAHATLQQTRALLDAIGDIWPIRSHLKQPHEDPPE